MVKEASLNNVDVEASRNDKLTIFVMIGSTADIHCFKSQVGMNELPVPRSLNNCSVVVMHCGIDRGQTKYTIYREIFIKYLYRLKFTYFLIQNNEIQQYL